MGKIDLKRRKKLLKIGRNILLLLSIFALPKLNKPVEKKEKPTTAVWG